LADAALSLGRFEDARGNGHQALPLFRQIGNHEGVALSLSVIGLAAVEEGKRQEASESLRQGLSIAAELGFPEPLSCCLDAAAASALIADTAAGLRGPAATHLSRLLGEPTGEPTHEETCHHLSEQLHSDGLHLLRAQDQGT